MEVVVTGSRELELCQQFGTVLDPKAAQKAVLAEVFLRLDQLDAKKPITSIVCGGAKGPDAYAMLWAAKHAVPCMVYRPNWRRHGRGAGFKRNWHMLYCTAGNEASRANKSKTGRLLTLERLIHATARDKVLRHNCRELLHNLTLYREALADPLHPARREVMRRLRLPLPKATVVAFWDKRSKGTQQCIKAARTLGFRVLVHEYTRPVHEERNVDRAKINHRPDEGDSPAFGSFTELGCGRA